MAELVARYLDLLRSIALGSGPWLAFNATLATIPALLAVGLARRADRRGPGWWAGAALWVLFLPNAPYVVTDLVHLRSLVGGYGDTRVAAMVPAVVLGLLVTWGLAAYALCLDRVDRALARAGWDRHRLAVRTGLHLLCAFGVVLGRVPRLHSWHVVTRPAATVDGIVSVLHPLAVPLVLAMALAFALGAAALTAVAQAAWARTLELVATARRVAPA